MSASCHLTASRLIWAWSSSSSCLRSCFYHTAQAPFLISCSFYPVFLHNFYGTQLFSARGVILLGTELAPFLEDEDITNFLMIPVSPTAGQLAAAVAIVKLIGHPHQQYIKKSNMLKGATNHIWLVAFDLLPKIEHSQFLLTCLPKWQESFDLLLLTWCFRHVAGVDDDCWQVTLTCCRLPCCIILLLSKCCFKKSLVWMGYNT